MNSLFQNYNHLGFFNPYYFSDNQKLNFSSCFKDLIEKRNMENTIDTVATVEYMVGRNILGDRTIVKGIYKTPWMGKPNDDQINWDFFKVPSHDEKIVDQNEIALNLLQLIKNEIFEYVNLKKNIGIMLTGGMDSRIIAGSLDLLLKEGLIKNKNIVALTWGDINSRDAIYSKEITSRMNWEWRHFDITSNDLLQNIEASAIRGSEYSPIHLHGMLKVREEKNLDCILAGSYGDSIGRAEYAGRHVLNIRDMRVNIKNVNGFLKGSIMKRYQEEIDFDINFYWNQFPQKNHYEQLEQDYQLHYMRRKLNPCISVVNEKIPVFQVFTSPDVFGYMWSIHPKLRNNKIYKIILKQFKTDLLSIPWARTGLIFDNTKGDPDNYRKKYHSYSEHINNELFNEIRSLVLSKNIENLNIFNMYSLESYFNLMKKKIYMKNLKVEEKIIWLASLSRSVEIYNIQKSSDNKGSVLSDKMNSLRPLKENLLDQLKLAYLNLSRN